MNYHSLSLWANSHKVIVIEPQPKDCPQTFVMPTNEIFISYLNIPTLQVIICSIMNKSNPPTKWLIIKHTCKNSQMSPCHSMDLLTTWKTSFDSPLTIMDWWSKDTMIITCQHNMWKWWKNFHLNEVDLKLINVGKYWVHQFAYPLSLSNSIWCLHVFAWFLVKQSIHMQQQIITKWYCLQYKFRELTSLVFMKNDNLEYSCFKGKFMFFVVIIHNIWDKNIIFKYACSHIVKGHSKTI